MNNVRHKWLLVVLAVLLAACGSSGPPDEVITTQSADVAVDYVLELDFAAYQRGDINRDGRVTTADLHILSGVLADGDVSELSNYARYQADFTCDRVLNSADLRAIQERAANSKDPAEAQICPTTVPFEDGAFIALISNIGDLPFNGLQVISTAGVDVSPVRIDYQTATPTTLAYRFDVDDDVNQGVITVEGAGLAEVAFQFIIIRSLGTVVEADTIAEVVASRSDLSILLDAVVAAGLADDLSADGELTVFAPNNEAFLDLLAELELDSLEALIAAVGIEEVTDILSFHVVADIFTAADLINLINTNGGEPVELETLTGDFLEVSLDDGMLVLQDDIEVLEANIPASNGIIHIIDTVLEIPEEITESTIAELAAADADLTSLVGALNADQLALLSDETADLTVLAPVNSAFEAAAGLLATLSAEEVADIINYHVLVGSFLAADVIALDGQTLPGTDIAVLVVDGSVFLQGSGNSEPIQIIATDIEASNGVIHKLDGILLPSSDITLEPGFTPDPQELQASTSDTSVSASETFETDSNGNPCVGFIASEPNHVLTLQAGTSGLASFGYLNVIIDSAADPTLTIVNQETGEVFCNDDTFGVDPALAFEDLPFGNYDIYVGTFSGGVASYTIGFSQTRLAIDTIAEIAASSADLSALVDALNDDQAELLDNSNQSLTVLAPVNSAFEAASDLLAGLTAEEVADVINYHVLVGEFLAADVIGLDGQTLPGTDIVVSVVDGSVFLQGSANMAPVEVIETDILASNGVIHKLDGILLPADTIADVAGDDVELSTLVGALTPEQVALLDNRGLDLTVLAPVDSAFEAAADLVAMLTPAQLEAIINYHVFTAQYLAADVIALDGQTIPGTDIAVSFVNGSVFVQGAGNTTPIEIIATDITASNGVIHKLAGILLPAGLMDGDATITGTVFDDANLNGTQDGAEAGIEGVTVTAFIDSNDNGVQDGAEIPRSTVTAADGSYSIDGLTMSIIYTVTQELPFGVRDTAAGIGAPVTTQVVGGGTADFTEYPFKAALIFDADDPFSSQYCGATLLTDQWVLTAAHCVPVVGEFAWLNSGSLDGEGQAVEIVEVIPHPLYESVVTGYDVAVLRLAERVPYNTVSLVTADTLVSAAPGADAITVGWGTLLEQGSRVFPNEMYEVDVPIVSNDDCLTFYDENAVEGYFESLDNFETQICAGRPTGGIDACQGDSGGALLVRNAMNTGWLQAGITSHGFDCGAPGVPGVYARVDNLADWIFDNATELVSSQTVDFTVTPMPVVNFANALTTTPYVDAGDAFFLKDFDIAPTEIRNASIGQDITFSWEITNTNANSVCTVDVGVDGAATLTVDPCVPGKNSVTFTGGYAEAGQFNAVLTVEAANKTRERSLFITVAE